jgi:hypothetical protein
MCFSRWKPFSGSSEERWWRLRCRSLLRGVTVQIILTSCSSETVAWRAFENLKLGWRRSWKLRLLLFFVLVLFILCFFLFPR